MLSKISVNQLLATSSGFRIEVDGLVLVTLLVKYDTIINIIINTIISSMMSIISINL